MSLRSGGTSIFSIFSSILMRLWTCLALVALARKLVDEPLHALDLFLLARRLGAELGDEVFAFVSQEAAVVPRVVDEASCDRYR